MEHIEVSGPDSASGANLQIEVAVTMAIVFEPHDKRFHRETGRSTRPASQ